MPVKMRRMRQIKIVLPHGSTQFNSRSGIFFIRASTFVLANRMCRAAINLRAKHHVLVVSFTLSYLGTSDAQHLNIIHFKPVVLAG